MTAGQSPVPTNADGNDWLLRWGAVVSVAFAVLLAATSVAGIGAVVHSLGVVAFEDDTQLMAVQSLRIALEDEGRNARGFLLNGTPDALRAIDSTRAQCKRVLRQLLGSTEADPEQHAIIERIDSRNAEYQRVLGQALASPEQPKATTGQQVAEFEVRIRPLHEDLDRAVIALTSLQRQRLRAATKDARATVSLSLKLLIGLAMVGILSAVGLGVLLGRALDKLEQQHQATRRHAQGVERVNVELNAFAGRVAHDLRNLLSPLVLAVSRLRRSAADPQRVTAISGQMERSMNRTLAVLDGLLAFSQSAQSDPHARCSARAVVNDVLEQLEPLAKRVEAQIDTTLDDPTVACSSELLNVIVLNLVGNALKFLADREVRRIQLQVRTGRGECEIEISDTGPGIPKDSLERIFEPFYRVPGTSAPGTGIGLATVARVVRAHRGRISVESAAQRGTTFRVVLPLAESTAADASAVVAELGMNCS